MGILNRYLLLWIFTSNILIFFFIHARNTRMVELIKPPQHFRVWRVAQLTPLRARLTKHWLFLLENQFFYFFFLTKINIYFIFTRRCRYIYKIVKTTRQFVACVLSIKLYAIITGAYIIWLISKKKNKQFPRGMRSKRFMCTSRIISDARTCGDTLRVNMKINFSCLFNRAI